MTQNDLVKRLKNHVDIELKKFKPNALETQVFIALLDKIEQLNVSLKPAVEPSLKSLKRL